MFPPAIVPVRFTFSSTSGLRSEISSSEIKRTSAGLGVGIAVGVDVGVWVGIAVGVGLVGTGVGVGGTGVGVGGDAKILRTEGSTLSVTIEAAIQQGLGRSGSCATYQLLSLALPIAGADSPSSRYPYSSNMINGPVRQFASTRAVNIGDTSAGSRVAVEVGARLGSSSVSVGAGRESDPPGLSRVDVAVAIVPVSS